MILNGIWNPILLIESKGLEDWCRMYAYSPGRKRIYLFTVMTQNRYIVLRAGGNRCMDGTEGVVDMPVSSIRKFTRILEKNRIEALTDGIYAIVLTLSVLMIGTGLYSGSVDSTAFYSSLNEAIPQIFNYALSFVLLAIFWVVHHRQMNSITHVDSIYIWLNMGSLFFVTLIPFTTNLNSDFSEYPLAVALYAANIMIISLSYTISWYYATRDRRLIADGLPDSAIQNGIRRGFMTTVVSLIVIGAAYVISSEWATVFYLLIVLGGIFLKRQSTQADPI